MKTNIAILGAKAARRASRMIGKGGGDIPGRVARKIDRNVLKTLSKQVEKIVVITGTNGKTTTSNLLAQILKHAGEDIIHNAEGNNLITGITTSFIISANVNHTLKKPYTYAVLEVDEANVPLVVKEVNPTHVIVNNFFRDQLNRYGEIDTIVDKIKGAAKDSDATLVLNADDPFVMRIGLLENKKIYFGLKENAYSFDQYSMNESKFCPLCGEELQYSYIHYGQLGYYKCQCGFGRPDAQYEVTHITDENEFTMANTLYKLGIGGTYNVYNALGAIACAKEFGIKEETIKEALLLYEAQNGRMQAYEIEGVQYLLNLAKNQVGADISVSEIVRDEEEKQIVYVLNDLEHDSEDISWIWDTDYERLSSTSISRIICSGSRSYDMALRMKYAGISEDKIMVVENLEKALQVSFEKKVKTYVLPTYTGLHPAKKYLDKKSEKA